MKIFLKKYFLSAIIIVAIIFIDRYIWMPNRLNQLWLNEKGRNLGDPLAYNTDFILKGNRIFFKNNKSEKNYPAVYRNRQSTFLLIGCYFGNLFIYDMNRKELVIYSDY